MWYSFVFKLVQFVLLFYVLVDVLCVYIQFYIYSIYSFVSFISKPALQRSCTLLGHPDEPVKASQPIERSVSATTWQIGIYRCVCV